MKKVMLAVMVLSAVVNGAYANGTNNLVGGTDNVATANSAAVFGYKNTVNSNNAIAFGENNTVNGTNSFAGGNNSKAEGRNTFAFGSHAEALTEYTYAIGSQARTSAYDTIAIGNGAYVSGVSSVAIGRTNSITGENTVVVGANNKDIKGNQSTVIGYNNKMAGDMEQTIIGANSETAGQGSMAIGTHTKVTAIDAVGVGNNIVADKPNSVALGTNSVTDNAVNQLQAMVNNTTYVFAGTDATSVVSVGSKQRAGFGGVKNYVRQVQNVAAGRVDASSTDAVNGSQLHAAYDAINTMGEDIDKALDAQQQFNTAVHNTLANHKDAIKNNTQRITQHDADIANNKNAIKANDHVLKNHEERIDKLEHQASNTLTNLKADIKQLDGRINKVGASAAALAGVHPMEFNKDDKFSTSVAYGHYKNANAVALGAYYRPNEKVLLGIAGTFGSENMYNVSASFKFGKHSEYEPQAKRDGEIEAMKAQIAELTARLDAVSK
jgi:autotransporter adhesin